MAVHGTILGTFYCLLLFFSFSTVLFFKETQALPFSKSLDFAPKWSMLTWYPCLPSRDRASIQRKRQNHQGADLATSRLTHLPTTQSGFCPCPLGLILPQ